MTITAEKIVEARMNWFRDPANHDSEEAELHAAIEANIPLVIENSRILGFDERRTALRNAVEKAGIWHNAREFESTARWIAEEAIDGEFKQFVQPELRAFYTE